MFGLSKLKNGGCRLAGKNKVFNAAGAIKNI
jgi:hypothetical protein